ncbi:hypothetical protein QUF81_19665 [Peribacillus simplex]|uniref:Uncharacterized protein n=1 Tax=Peribacillus simplex TaxID=1478 RepID=A0AAW7IJT4_9BACI|nr:hypothetical protein [Peribacillus simplex]MDM5295332.1 hypothetical protein [Peribacillus simplex]MDM5454297.1 hypothetical protein [Peribacillus simplex]
MGTIRDRYIHPVTKELRIQKKDSSFEYIQFGEIINAIVEDNESPSLY